MLVSTPHCDDNLLRLLLEGQLPDKSAVEAERHIEECDACRRHLEALAAQEELWRETRELLTGTAAVAQSNTDSRQKGFDSNFVSGTHEPAEPPSLTFLAPSDNPAMLGRLGEFEVLEFIGRGGMGIVLKGYDHELNRFVAIKVLGTHYAENGAARKRFAREAQAAAAVVHQHVVAIHAVDANHQPPYFVMSFVPGESLQQRLDRDGPLAVEDVLRIGQQVADGLAAAHAQGLVHRDIKPSNILLERNVERVLLTDFGLARAVDDASLTQSGIIAGTPQYMSPEQARGEVLDARADLFSLGSVMYALLTGHPPFRAESPYGVLRRVTDADPRPLREINAAVPEWLEAFIFRLLAKQPLDRWQTARSVSDLLSQCLAHVQQPTTMELPPEVVVLLQSTHRWSRRRSAVVACSVICVLAWMQLARDNSHSVDSVQKQPSLPAEKNAASSQPSNPSLVVTPLPAKENSAATSWDGQHPADVKSIDARLQRLEQQTEF